MGLGAYHSEQHGHLAYLDRGLVRDRPEEEEVAVDYDAGQPSVIEELAPHEDWALAAHRVHKDLEEVALWRSWVLGIVLHSLDRDLHYSHHSHSLLVVVHVVVVFRIAAAAHHHAVAGQIWAVLVAGGHHNLRRT